MTLGDSFTWAFKDPQWPARMIVQGVIAIIPIIGWMAMLGWLMLAIDNARAGKKELPPAGFHIERGAEMFLVFFLYGIVLSIPSLVFFSAGAIAIRRTNEFGFSVSPFFAVAWLLALIASLLTRFLTPALILNTNRRGFAGGFDVRQVWRMSTANVATTLIAAVIIWAASLIGWLGIVLCLIPLVFTIPYENSITAGTVVWFEREVSPPPTPRDSPD